MTADNTVTQQPAPIQVDADSVIGRLGQQIGDLHTQLALSRGETDAWRQRCAILEAALAEAADKGPGEDKPKGKPRPVKVVE